MTQGRGCARQTYRGAVRNTRQDRQTADIAAVSSLGLDSIAFRTESLRRLRALVSIDAAFFATVDPATILFTSALAEEPLGAATPLFLENEFGHDDVNKFSSLAASHDRIGSLDHATRGDRQSNDAAGVDDLDLLASQGARQDRSGVGHGNSSPPTHHRARLPGRVRTHSRA
jgi:hypothetical protein